MDEDLPMLQAIATGDETALRTLMERYREPIFRLAYRFVGNLADAQELTEDTFTRVYFDAPRFRPRATVRNWIFTIAANRCRDFLRQRKRRPLHVSSERSALEADPSPDAAEQVLSREQATEIRDAIAGLPEKLRFPFVFCLLEGHSQEDAAAILGTSRKTIETRIYRARQHLQSIFSEASSSDQR